MYEEYMMWRRQGFRAITAYCIAKYGMGFFFDLVVEE
jgi:hypothetical protein